MKKVKLFEQFVNERFNAKKAAKELKGFGFKNVDDSGNEISVETGPYENPFGSKQSYTFFWNGETMWCESEEAETEWMGEITTAEQFADAMEDASGWA